MQKAGFLVLVIVAIVLGVSALLPTKEAAGHENVAANDLECPLVYAQTDTVYRDEAGGLALYSNRPPHYAGAITVTGSNWWDANPPYNQARGIAIFDLKEFAMPQDAKVILGLGDSGGKTCDDPRDCSGSPPSPNSIAILSFEADRPDPIVAHWAASAERVTVLTTDATQHGGLEPVYFVDVTETVREFVENDKQYLGFRFEPTKASDFEGFSIEPPGSLPGDLDYTIQMQVVADPKEIVETALDAEETYNNYIVTKHGEVVVDGPRIEMRFQPRCGNEELALKTLEKALDIDHFNWEQTREEPSNWTAYIADHVGETEEIDRAYTNLNMTCRRFGWETNSLTYAYGPFAGQSVDLVPVAGPKYDPFVSIPAGPDKIEVIGIDGPGENDICWVILPYWGGDGGKQDYASRDAFTPYYNIPYEVAQHTTEYSLDFMDEPKLPDWALTYNSNSVNQFWRFSTSLVGVKDGRVVISSNPVHWKTNANVVIAAASEEAKVAVGQASPIPYFLEFTETFGGIFDVEASEITSPPPPAYSLHLPMVTDQN